jgi:hypothetical protein
MIERIITLLIMGWIYFAAAVAFGFPIAMCVIECRNIMQRRKRRNRRVSKTEIAKRQAQRHADQLRSGIVGDVAWIERA